MKLIRKWHTRAGSAIVAALVSVSALAYSDATPEMPYVGFASGTTLSAWAAGNTQAWANKIALQTCNERSPKPDCKVETVQDLIKIQHGDALNYEPGIKGLPQDRVIASKKWCKPSEPCKILSEITAAGYFAFAKSPDGKSSHLHDGAAVLADARSTALARCQENAGVECSIVAEGSIAGRVKFHDDAPQAADSPVAKSANCRPRTNQLRCSSQCTNGSCTVTYENGCKMHVEVQPVYDGLSNQWNYPSPSC